MYVPMRVQLKDTLQQRYYFKLFDRPITSENTPSRYKMRINILWNEDNYGSSIVESFDNITMFFLSLH